MVVYEVKNERSELKIIKKESGLKEAAIIDFLSRLEEEEVEGGEGDG